MTPSQTALMEQCRKEAEDNYMRPGVKHSTREESCGWLDGYAQALYDERSKAKVLTWDEFELQNLMNRCSRDHSSKDYADELSRETMAVFVTWLRDNGYLAPSAGLTVDEVFYYAEGLTREDWPTAETTNELLHTLSKAWPYLTKHAAHIDGEFNVAHADLRGAVNSLITQRDRAVNAVLSMYEKAQSRLTALLQSKSK